MELASAAMLNVEAEELADGTATQHCKNKKRLLKKAPDAPKRFKSAYICYVMKMIEEIKGEYAGDISTTFINYRIIIVRLLN
jgi:hypothetical protein